MRHADPPAFDVQELPLGHARVDEEVVVAFGYKDRRELRAPIEDGRRGDIARVQDEVDAAERIRGLGAEFIEVADEGRKVSVGDKPDAHWITLYFPGRADKPRSRWDSQENPPTRRARCEREIDKDVCRWPRSARRQ